MNTYRKLRDSMLLTIYVVIAVIAILPTTLLAVVVVIDFEDQPVGSYLGETVTITAGGIDVTFTGPGLRIRQFGDPFPNTRVLSTNSDAGPIMVTFGGGFTATYVEFENLINDRYTSEIDSPCGTAYDAFEVVLDAACNSNTIHHLDGPGIAKVVYVEGSPNEGFVVDNFAFVPEPATICLLGLGSLILLRRRRHTAL